MTVTSGWYNEEKTIHYASITGDWSIEEFQTHAKQFVQDVSDVAHPVISIVNVRGAKLSTSNMIEAARVAYSEPLPNLEMNIIISAGSSWQIVYQSVERLLTRVIPSFHLSLVWVTSEAEAFRRIEQHWQNHHRHGR